MDRQLMAFPKKRFDCVLRQMAMARTDVYYERIRRCRNARQRLSKPLIYRLPNEVFHHGPVR
jgi:hypothetical protein